MSKNVRVKLNLKGINELMKSPEVQGVVLQAGQAVANSASGLSGEEYAAEVHVADFVAISNVYPNSKEAARDNFRNNTLERAVGMTGLPRSK